MIRIENASKLTSKDYYRQKKLYEDACIYNGWHFTTYMEEIKRLIKCEHYNEAESLLLAIINVVENASKIPIPSPLSINDSKHEMQYHDVPPGWYNRLAILYRKQKRYADEVSIIERFTKQIGGSIGFNNVTDRLPKAKELLRKFG